MKYRNKRRADKSWRLLMVSDMVFNRSFDFHFLKNPKVIKEILCKVPFNFETIFGDNQAEELRNFAQSQNWKVITYFSLKINSKK